MAHMIERHDWVYSAVKAPWHGIGTVTPDAKRARDAIKVARLDWLVGQEPVYRFNPETGDYRAILNYILNTRTDLPFDDHASDLGIVSGSYQVIQNSACFDLCDRIVGGLGATYETAGSLKNGKRVFLTARCPQALSIVDDRVWPYLLISTAHDGTGAVEVKLVSIRVVCWNTLSAAMAQNATATVNVKHTAGSVDSAGRVRASVLDDVRKGIAASAGQTDATPTRTTADATGDLIASATGWFDLQAKMLTRLAESTVSKHFVQQYLSVLVPEPIKGNTTRAENKRQAIYDVYNGYMPGDRVPGVSDTQQDAIWLNRETGEGTAYRLLNAVTHFNDHLATPRQTVDKGTGERAAFAEARFARVLAADGKSFRDDARNVLHEAIDSQGATLTRALVVHAETKRQAMTRTLINN